jgi:sulfite exporter TauE/SafE
VTESSSLWGVLASLFALGFIGSVHCFGMCGGIAAALTHAIPEQRRARSSLLLTHLCFGIGRVGSYALAGGVAGSAGLVLGRRVGSYALAGGVAGSAGLVLGKLLGPAGPPALRCGAGLLLVALGLYVSGWWLGLRRLEELGARLWRQLAPALEHLRPTASLPRAIVLGLFWGWLPCGLVYGALASAVSLGRGSTGALAMLAFGLGTMPALVATGALARELPRLVRASQTRSAAGLLILLFGLWTLGAGVLTLRSVGGP